LGLDQGILLSRVHNCTENFWMAFLQNSFSLFLNLNKIIVSSTKISADLFLVSSTKISDDLFYGHSLGICHFPFVILVVQLTTTTARFTFSLCFIHQHLFWWPLFGHFHPYFRSCHLQSYNYTTAQFTFLKLQIQFYNCRNCDKLQNLQCRPTLKYALDWICERAVFQF